MMAQTLLLSASYEPIKAVSWQRAITLLSLGKIEVLEEYDTPLRSATLVIKMPAVIRLLRVFKRRKRALRFSRMNIYTRDKFRCQYCGQKLDLSTLTFDHVLPRSRGGPTDWHNIVSSCEPCNARKRNRTPEEAGMRLRSAPIRPKWLPANALRLSRNSAPEAWRDYLYWTGELLY